MKRPSARASRIFGGMPPREDAAPGDGQDGDAARDRAERSRKMSKASAQLRQRSSIAAPLTCADSRQARARRRERTRAAVRELAMRPIPRPRRPPRRRRAHPLREEPRQRHLAIGARGEVGVTPSDAMGTSRGPTLCRKQCRGPCQRSSAGRFPRGRRRPPAGPRSRRSSASARPRPSPRRR